MGSRRRDPVEERGKDNPQGGSEEGVQDKSSRAGLENNQAALHRKDGGPREGLSRKRQNDRLWDTFEQNKGFTSRKSLIHLQ